MLGSGTRFSPDVPHSHPQDVLGARPLYEYRRRCLRISGRGEFAVRTRHSFSQAGDIPASVAISSKCALAGSELG